MWTREERIGLGNELYKLQPHLISFLSSAFYHVPTSIQSDNCFFDYYREKLNYGEFRNSNKDTITIKLSQKMNDPL